MGTNTEKRGGEYNWDVIAIVDHDPSWRDTFDELRSTYASTLQAVPVVAIEHVGSTAVMGLAAKPVIDIDVVVAPADVGTAGDALCSIGYQPLGEQGISGRWAFRQPAELPATHTYVVEQGCLALRNHLAVRDALRSDPDLRAQYAALKRELASDYDDVGAYVEGKSAFLCRVLGQGGFTGEELDIIERANRSG